MQAGGKDSVKKEIKVGHSGDYVIRKQIMTNAERELRFPNRFLVEDYDGDSSRIVINPTRAEALSFFSDDCVRIVGRFKR